MARQRQPTVQDTLRLDAIAEHLKVKTRFPHPSFTKDVTAACLKRVAHIIEEILPCTGEQIADGLADHFQVAFEEVRGPHDVATLEDRYLKGKRELGFAQLRKELGQPGVDALLFQRANAHEHESDRWVAVLNLQEGDAKGYWNRFHELAHRIAEPPQFLLPFRRHRYETTNPVEALIDSVAAEIAFYEPVFRPIVERFAKRHRLDFEVVDSVQKTYAPTASLLATANAVVKHWPGPAAVITAEFRGRRNAPEADQALRVSPQSFNAHAANVGLTFIPNMRVPAGSSICDAFSSGIDHGSEEQLEDWSTSGGKCLKPLNVFTSARMTKDRVYALVSA